MENEVICPRCSGNRQTDYDYQKKKNCYLCKGTGMVKNSILISARLPKNESENNNF